MRAFFIGLSIGIALSIASAVGIYSAIIKPDNDSRIAAIEARFNATLDASRTELDGARNALARAESANRELAKRIDDLGQSNSTSAGIAGQIASGIDGDLDSVDGIRDTIREAIERLREVQGRE